MWQRNRTLWSVLVVWWVLDGLVDSVQLMSMEAANGAVLVPARAFALGMSSSLLWIPFSLALLWCAQRFPIGPGTLGRGLLANGAMVLAIIVLRALAVMLLNPLVQWYARVPDFGEVLATSLLNNVLLLWMMVGVAHAWHYARRERERAQQAEQLQARLTASRLDALSAQLNPHFLFNALNSIAEVIHRDPGAADRMLVGLGDLLHRSLDHEVSALAPLAEELRLLRCYLDIEQPRLGERLCVDWQIEPGLDDAAVPPLLLQPLAENAIVHAIATRLRPGTLRVAASRRDQRLHLLVEDDGGERATAAGHGTGLSNVGARLTLLFGGDHDFDLSRNMQGGMRVQINLPLRRIAAGSAARDAGAQHSEAQHGESRRARIRTAVEHVA